MMDPLSELVSLFWGFTTFVTTTLSYLWRRFTTLLSNPLSSVSGALTTLVRDSASVLWGWLLFVALFVGAVVLNLLGRSDVHATLGRVLDRFPGSSEYDPEQVPDIPESAVTNEAGHFSPEAFRRATGMTPTEFIHLYTMSRGGRVGQTTLNVTLPWSKSTVSRYLKSLEEEGKVVRVRKNGRRNMVCTPDAAPTDPTSGDEETGDEASTDGASATETTADADD